VHPDDQQLRLAYAEQLAAGGGGARGKLAALDVLDQPFSSAGMTGPRAYLVRELQIRTLAMAANLRLDLMVNNRNVADRAQLRASVEDAIGRIAQLDGEGPRVLRLRGKLLRIDGRTVEAIQTLEKARALHEAPGAGGGQSIDHWEVVDMLAHAYIETGQTGRAAELLTELVNRFPGYDPGRLLLAAVLIKVGKTDEARPHVEYLAKRKPNDPEVLKLQLQLSRQSSGPTTEGGDTK
jgi:tetratricopeptide (TPR) repeat protein